MWQRLCSTSFVVCQRVVSFLACYLATTMQKKLFKAFLSWCNFIWIEKTATQHATARFFFRELCFQRNHIHICFPLSRCLTARNLPAGTCVTDCSLQAGFLRKRRSQRNRISVFSVVIRSDRHKPVSGGTYFRQLFPQHLLFRLTEFMCYMHS